MFIHRLEIRFSDCDALGHVNNAAYFTYCEQPVPIPGELRERLEDMRI